MTRFVIILVALFAFLSPIAGATVHAAPVNPAVSPVASRIVELVNARRAEAGLGKLTINGTLMAEAQRFSTVQARIGGVNHRGVDGTNAGQRLTQAGYAWTFFGENLAAGQETPEAVVAAWMRSPSHRAIIMNPKPLEIGIGHTYKANDPARFIDYWVMEVGRPR